MSARAAAASPRFTFFGGKGGVGKTTCAAAAAVRAAREGERVLVVSTDPAHSLADALGIALGAEPRAVRGAAGLFAAELDADRALTRWLAEREDAIRTVAERGTYLDDEDIDRLLALAFPGVDELVGLVELMRLARSRRFDRVVVDTAPTGHTLRLLEMPDTLKRLGEVLDDMHAKHRFLASSIGGSWRPDFADDAIAEIAAEAEALRALVVDRTRCSFTWITLPEELPFRESEDGIAALSARGVAVDAIVVNRVWPVPDRRCALCTPRVEAEQRWLARIERTFAAPERVLLELPAQLAEPRGAAALLALAGAVRPLEHRRSGARAKAAPRRVAPAGKAAAIAPKSARLVLFGGKGGVGKTTAAAAAALELATARPRARVLLLSTDPAHSLGDALAAAVGDDAGPIAGGPSNLAVRELDAVRAWEAERDRYRKGIDELFSSIFTGRMDATFDRAVLEDLLDLAPPGIDALFALVALLDALAVPEGGAPPRPARSPRYDLVVVDTAPTGHTLRLLALPEKALEWVHALMKVLLKYREVIGLGEIASDLTTLARRLRALLALLADPERTAFVIVARPAALPRLETERLAAGLQRLRVPLAALLVNAVTVPGCARCSAAAAAEAPELSRLARATKTVCLEAPAVQPGPRGAADLLVWRAAWRPIRSGGRAGRDRG